MKEIKLYVCSFCGTQYKEKTECEKCEQNHTKVKSVKAIKYLPYNADYTGYPQKVEVKMEDGAIVTYKR